MKLPQKINLANLPTPLHKISFDGNEFFMKRDDFTGTDFSGNKIRKLEYILYQAKKEKAEIIFTCGGDQSNHARATASASAMLGFKTRLFLWGNEKAKADGNLFLDIMYGAKITYLNKNDFENVDKLMFEERKKLVKKGKIIYVIPAGGSTTLGIWGYINFIDELKKQIDLKKITGIFAACGSGGTAAGLLAGLAVHNLKTKVYAVNVLHSKKEIRKKILQLTTGASLDFNLNISLDETKLVIIDGYSSEGYKNISDDKVNLINRFAASTGIVFDPAYTGKAFTAYYQKVLKNNLGKKIIFLHTGGIFGSYAKKEKYLSQLVDN